ASIIVLHAMQFFRRDLAGRAKLAMFVSFFFHYSSAISIAYYYATTLRMSVRNTMYAIAVLATMSVATYRALDFYFAGKLSAYSEYQAAGQFSGLSDLLVIT